MHQQRGQVMSSFVAVAAAIAVVIGLLVLFGTRDPGDSAAGPPTSPSPASPSRTPAGPTTQTPAPTRPSTVVPTSTPPPKPSTTPTTSPTTTPTTSPTEEPTDPETSVSRAPVEIYNNTTRRGLADRVARQARSEGWHVAGIDNWRGKVVGSTVYHPDGMRAAAEALAGDLGIGLVKPALGNMKKDRLTVILTKDYSESNLK